MISLENFSSKTPIVIFTVIVEKKKSSPLLKLPTHEAFSLGVPKEIEDMRGEMKDILAHTDS